MLRAAETIAKTDTGLQRPENEDNMLARAPVFVVADGMGGAQAGEVASRIAIEAFEAGLPEQGSPEERLAARAHDANKQIHEVSRSQHERAGMGTTLTAAYVGRDDLALAHVGDSRAYLFRDPVLKRLTRDHTLVGALVEQGKLTEEQAATHPQRSIITRALGPEAEVEVDTWSYPLRAGDVVLLCSDGLTSMVPEERLTEILRSSPGLDQAAQALIDEANAAGGRDNITVVLFRVEDVAGDGALEQPTMVGLAAPGGRSTAVERARGPAAAQPSRSTVPASPTRSPRALYRSPARGAGGGPPGRRGAPRRLGRRARLAAAGLAAVVVLFMLGAGGFLASRQLYFIGTNAQGVVAIYRGLPYDLPAGIRLYESFYVSGMPAASVSAARRRTLFDHHLRSQADATSLVRDLELGTLQ